MKLPEHFYFLRWGWWLTHAIAVPALLGLGWFLGARSQARAAPATSYESQDTRERLALSAHDRDAVLIEMRRMLESVNGVLKGVLTEDATAIESAARASGVAMAADVDPRIMKSLPPMFRDLGMRTHKDFEALADRMRGGGRSAEAIQALADLTGKCVGCHASYRIDELPAPR